MGVGWKAGNLGDQGEEKFTIAPDSAFIIHLMEERTNGSKSEAEVALELMRLVLDQAGSRRLSPTRTLALYHLCKEAVAYSPEGPVSAEYLEDGLKKLLQ